MSWTLVTSGADNQGSAGSSIGKQLAGIQAGDLVIVHVDHQGGASPITVSDGTSSFTQDPAGIQHNPGSDGDPHSCLFYLLASVATGTLTYTATFDSAKPWRNIVVYVMRPSAPCSREDSHSNAAASGTAANSGNITATGTDGQAFGSYAEYGQSLSGLTINGVAAADSASSNRALMWRVPYTAGFTGAAAGTVGGGGARWNCHAIAFKIGSGATTTTLTPANGTLTLTGKTPTLKRTIAPGKGTLAFTTYAPTLKLTVAIPKGTLTLTGKTPAAAIGTVTRPGKATLTLTGFAPVVATSHHIRVAPDSGAIAVTGYAPGIVATAHRLVQPAARALAITGRAPVLLIGGPPGEPLHCIFRGVADPSGSDLMRDPGPAANAKVFRGTPGGSGSLFR